MSAAPDVLRAKTDAELQFFLDNPSYYQPDLVAAARQELRRRGVAPTPAAQGPVVEYLTDYDTEPTARKRPLLVGGALLVLALGGAGWFWGSRPAPMAPATASAPDKLSADSLKLETVVATPIPAFDNDKEVEKELALVPAAERARATDQQLRQFKGLSLRFWRAQNPTVYLLNQAGHQQSYQVYMAQLTLAQTQWNDLYKGLVYSYALTPTMMDHLARMRVIARIQRATLGKLQDQCAANKPLELDHRAQLTQDTARHLLAALVRRGGGLSVQL